MEWIQNNIFTIITTIFGGGSFFAWLTEKNKRRISEKQASAEALETMQKAYDKFTDDSLKRYDAVVLEVRELKEELSTEKIKFRLLQEENSKLKVDNASLKADYDILKSDFEKFKLNK